MSTTPPAPAAPAGPAANSAAPLRLLLFGLPGSGKSALLGALTHASITQPELLGGQFVEPSIPLKWLRKQLYEESLKPTRDELTAYPVVYQPAQEPRSVAAEFIDCSGQVANTLLSQQTEEPQPETQLDQALDRADTLILTVDASSSPAQLEEQFQVFGEFLSRLEEERGQRIEVSGLPVFLVLTKCDLLAGPTDSTIDWMERIEQRKREIGARFQEFLSRREGQAEQAPFGQVELYLWATAIKRPALARAPAKPREPFGVAELFRQSLEKAEDYRDRQARSGRRVFVTASLASVVVALLCSVTVGLAVFNKEKSVLELAIEALRYNEGSTVTDRLRQPIDKLRERLALLKEVQANPEFDTLPRVDRQYVQERTEEISDYLDYFDRITHAPQPADLFSETQLQDLRQRLESGDLQPRDEWGPHYRLTEQALERLRKNNVPPALLDALAPLHDQDFAGKEAFEEALAKTLTAPQADDYKKLLLRETLYQTAASNLQQELMRDLDRMQDASRELIEWFNARGAKARALAEFENPGLTGMSWYRQVKEALEQMRRPPLTDKEFLPGSQTVTPTMVLALAEVKRERELFERNRTRLCDKRAEGMLDEVAELPALLVVTATFTLRAAPERIQRLREALPDCDGRFVLEWLSDKTRVKLAAAAGIYNTPLLEPARALVLKKLKEQDGSGAESLAAWDGVRRWLEQNPPELAEWRILGRMYAQIQGFAEPTDPVTALVEFLQKKQFTIDAETFTLEVPDEFSEKLPSNAALKISHRSSDGASHQLVYRLEGMPEHKGDKVLFRLVRKQGTRIVYQPGDLLRASLELRDSEVLSWVEQRSSLYQFERLARPPRLHRASQTENRGTLQERIHLTWAGADKAVPRVPELLPKVNRE